MVKLESCMNCEKNVYIRLKVRESQKGGVYMANLSDYIEQYINKLIAQSNSGAIEIQRNELAGTFDCVPSQINYVLSTRFNVQSGYVVESRRGGGGFVRIIKLTFGDDQEDLINIINERVGNEISPGGVRCLVQNLYECEVITLRELRMIIAITDNYIPENDLPNRNKLRASVLKSMLIAVLRSDK